MARLALYGLLMERSARFNRSAPFAGRLLKPFRVHDLFRAPWADHTRKQGQRAIPPLRSKPSRARAKGRRRTPSAAPANGPLLAVSC
jgi:hypothetical protein